MRAKRPLELVFLEFVTLDKSSDNWENVLILTVVFFTKFVRAIPTKDQSAVNSGSTYMERNDTVRIFNLNCQRNL